MKTLFLKRKAKGLSTYDLSRQSGVNTAHINFFENGKRDLTAEERQKILKVFPGIDEKTLFADFDFDPGKENKKTGTFIFTPRILSAEEQIKVEKEVNEMLARLDRKASERKNKLIALGKEAAGKINRGI